MSHPHWQIPVFIFINKTDLETANVDETMKEIQDRLTENAVFVENWPPSEQDLDVLTEFAAERDEEIMEAVSYTHLDVYKRQMSP